MSELHEVVDDFFRKGKGGGSAARKGSRARIYVRVSDTRGREETLISPEVQIGHCTDYARREGMELVGDPVIDLNLSGKTFGKRQISKMIEEVKRDDYDTIIVWKWSRWGRNLAESMINMALLDEVGGYLIAATEPVDVSTPTGVFSRTQFLAMAQLQLDQIRESWRDAHRTRLRNGLPHSGVRPFGYLYRTDERSPDRMYVPDTATFPLLREMYLSYINGLSHRSIAMGLNARGFTGAKGALWTPNTVRQVLDSGFGAGRIRYGEFEATSDNWEHVVTPDEWFAYQTRREDAVRRLPPRTAGQKTIAKGLVHCASCGRRMALTRQTQRRPGREYVYNNWRCNGVVDFTCKGSTIGEDAVKAAIVEWVARMAKGMDEMPELVSRRLRSSRAKADMAEVESQIANVNALKKKGIDLVIRGVLNEEEFSAQRGAYDAQLASLESALQSSRAEAATTATPPKDVFGALMMALEARMHEDGINVALRAVIHRVEVRKTQPGVRRSERVRIVPAWEAPPALTAV